MRFSWRQVSALLVFLALVAAACSSDPVDLVVGDDGDPAQDAGETADAPSENDDAMEGSADSTGAVADDSAPVVSSERQAEMLAALEDARATWAQAGVDDYDFTLLYAFETLTDDSPLSPNYEVEVRGGMVARVVPDDDFSVELDDFTIAGLLGELESVILNEDGFSVDFDGEFGIPEHIRGVDSEAGEIVVLIHNFRLPGAYPSECSTSGLEADTQQHLAPTAEVNATREAIFAALAKCDFLMLSHLANTGDFPFTGSFGGDGIELVWEAEAAGDPVMMDMFEILLGESATTDGLTVWPSEFADPESNYLDWRTGINEDGEWMFFVAGD